MQPVLSGHVLLGQRRATGDMRYRIGTRGQLLSCWNNNSSGHYVPRWQLLRRRGGERWCVDVLRVLAAVATNT